jgi:mono/diheme cytochrome c family protein/uncharacterized membrane protein
VRSPLKDLRERVAAVLILLSLAGSQLSAPPEVYAQADSSKAQKDSAPRPSAPKATETHVRALFEKHCAKCHGEDGTGSEERDGLPKIPDFTDASWQEKCKDAQLVASILDGKGTKGEKMPPWRGKISEEQARGLVGYVRAFSPAKGTSEGSSQTDHSGTYRKPEEEQEEPAPAGAAEAQPPRSFFQKLILWLGKFHPASVHFPIALLTAAAVAELVRMVWGKPFDVVARYCLWFGFLTAVLTGVLGWCAGGFHLTDTSWIKMTHRWLGTSTVACAGLVLVLSELSQHPDRHRTRVWFRVLLFVAAGLVSATGFFGGAITFGLDHYTWPM